MFTGFILTDTKRLAYLLSTTQYEITSAISSYTIACASYINWQLIDVADSVYEDIDTTNWSAYASIINDYYYGLGLQDVYNSPLFIIGGHDIIPMPKVPNPVSGIGKEYLDSDMLYCFEPKRQIRLEDCISQKPRFAVGRLPLTRDWSLDALNAYLNDCVDYLDYGISIRGAVMTTTQSWLRASSEMMRDLPSVALSDSYVPLNNRMVVSPDLDTEYEDMYQGYVHELKKVDFLVCNLHGSDDPDVPFFIGEDTAHERYTVAVQPRMLQETTPYIFNTVACFGGRYVNYSLEDSMLLSAMAYGTMLYCGSCEIALGGPDMEGNSELMMKLYNIYLHKGMPAGMALIKAKQDYYRTCHEDDGDECAMFTILEFNLFGCPILSMQPKLAADYKPTLLGHHVAEKSHIPTYRPKTMTPIIQTAYQADDIHAYVQSLVDGNIYHIRSIVEKEVYARLGLPAENLQQILTISQDSYEIGYQFIYCWTPQESYRQFQMYWLVNTDKQGKITKIIHTK